MRFLLSAATVLSMVLGGLSNPAQGNVLQKPTGRFDGYTVRYIFTGVASLTDAAFSVHCTNVGPVDATMGVEIFDLAGAFVDSGIGTLSVGETRVLSTTGTFFTESTMNTPAVGRGSGRVLVDNKKAALLCGGYLVEPGVSAAPTYLGNVPMIRVGKPPKPKIAK